MTNRERNFKIIVEKCDKSYYKVREVLQNETEFITKCYKHYKV